MKAFKQNFLKSVLLSLLFSALTACGGAGGDKSDPSQSVKQKALAKIIAYSQNNNQNAPTLQDYKDAGVTGVSNATLSQLNIIVSGLTATDVDTTEELEALTTQLDINIKPTANAGGNKSTQVNQAVTLSGSGVDSDGSITSYKWEKDGVVISTNASFDYSPNTVGIDTLTFTVMDNDGDVASDSIVVTVTPVVPPGSVTNKKPNVNAGADKAVQINNKITISGSASDSDGTISSHVWRKGSEVISTDLSFEYTPTKVGTDHLMLTATDDKGATSTDSMSIIVTAAPVVNNAPTADAGLDKMVQVNQTVTITGVATDSDGTISHYEWKKGATILSTNASFPYTPNAVGQDTLTLTVTDNDGATASDTIDITVTSTPADTTPPVITRMGASSVNVIQGMSYNDAGATATDNKDGSITNKIVVTGLPINTSAAIGSTFTVFYNVSDVAGNMAQQVTRTVNIVADTVLPVITRTGAQNIDVIKGTNYQDAGATASDNKDGNLTASIVIGGDTVDTNAAVNTLFTISYDVSDSAGNSAITQYRYVKIITGVSHTIPPISSQEQQEFLDAINTARSTQQDCGTEGIKPAVSPLTWNTQLYSAAYEYSQDMGESNFYSPQHLGSGTINDWTGHALNKQSTFIERIGSYNYTYSTIGENIAAGQTSIAQVMAGWLASDGHCRNIMDPNYTEVGMSRYIKSGTNYVNYWVQEFGSP